MANNVNDAFSGQNNSNQTTGNRNDVTSEEYLRRISIQLEELLRRSRYHSQSAAADNKTGEAFRNLYNEYRSSNHSYGYSYGSRNYRYRRGIDYDEFFDGIEEALVESVLGRDFKKRMNSALADFAKTFGLDLDNIEKQLGKELGKQVVDSIKSSQMGKSAYDWIDKQKSNLLSKVARDIRFNIFKYDTKHGSNYGKQFDDFVRRQQEGDRASKRAAYDASRYARGAAEGAARTAGERYSKDAEDRFRDFVNRSTSNEREDRFKQQRRGPSYQRPSREEPLSGSTSRYSTESVNYQDITGSSTSSSSFGDLLDFNLDSNILSSSPIDDLGATSGAGGAAAGGAAAGGAAAGGGGGGAIALTEGAAAGAGGGELAAAGAGGELAAVGSGAGAAAAGLASLVSQIAIAVVALTVLTKVIKWAFTPAVESGKKLFEQLKKAGMRYIDSRDEQLKNEEKRMRDDLETVIRKPFEILESAATNVYEVWDNYLRKITATQGYNKEDLQSLMGAFAQRLRDEGLSSVISTTDITSSLANVLESGLSGKIAEEFAYTAAKLNAAVPTQDFFGYAGTYASIAANAMKSGMSQSAAIAYANDQMYAFASNVLYASRTLAGGFTTGLKDAQTLFEQSVQIAQASRTNNAANIGGVLTAVSAIVGAIAPDLATSMTDVIYKAAVGGNSSDIVALRSLANINASNTDFLKRLSQDPQGVFVELFRNLANMQNMSQTAWMEVAEGLSSVFGVSMDAFARVDFNYLAQAIANMNVNNNSLQENLDLLAEGQTTTTEEQLKIAQINKYMIEEGLAYVLDNEAARAIQQHMWEEQIANELMEAEYGVNIHGAALEFLQGLRKTVDNILNFLNPLGFLAKIASGVVTSTAERTAQEADLRQLLELGKVGQGNATSIYQLTTRGTNLKVTESLVNLLGGFSAYSAVSAAGGLLRDLANLMMNPILAGPVSVGPGQWGTQGIVNSLLYSALSQPRDTGVTSKYQWGVLSKSAAAKISGSSLASSVGSLLTQQDIQAVKEEANNKLLVKKLGKMMDEEYIKQFASDTSKSYEDWVATAAQFGISDLDKALEAAGKNEEDLRGMFSDARTEAASNEARRRDEKEEAVWSSTLLHHPAIELLAQTNNELTDTTNGILLITNELLTTNNLRLLDILTKETSFYDDWVSYVYKHETYDAAYDYNKVREVLSREDAEKDEAVYALAEALNDKAVDLHDPVVQTNAILSQILIVVNALLQKNNQTGATGLLGTLSGLALGMDTKTVT